MYEDDKPPLPPTSPPPDYLPEPIKNVTFSLSSEYDYNNLVPSSSPSPSSTSSPSSALYVSEYQYSSRLSPGIPLIPVVEHKPFSTAYFESFFHSEPSSWQYPPLTSTTSTTPPPMIVEEGIKNGSVVRPVTPRSIANSLDSLSECAQHHHSDVVNANTNSDRSRSLGDLLSATNQDGADSMRNGSYDTLVSKGGGGGLTDSGIGAGLLMMRDDMDMDDNALSSSPDRITTDISSPDSFSYPAVSFASYDPVGNGANGNVSSYSNENTNPLDSSSRGHSTDDRKHTELPAISEESEHEQSIHIPYNHQPHSSSVGPSAQDLAREVVEHTYPMIHCNSAPSNASFLNNNIAHRRVVSEDGTEITRLKRSEEMENMDKIGRISFEKRSSSSHNLKKGRCKSAMLVFQSDPDDKEETDDEDDVDGYSKDNEMLILDKSGVDDRYRSAGGGGGANNKKSSPLRHYDNHSNLPSISSNEPPPVLIQRKVSAVSTRSSPYKASDQSWKDKMPPFGIVGHTMYSPQSLPTRDAIPRSPFDGSSGTVSGASGRLLISEEKTSPDGRTSSETEYTTPLRPRLYDSIPSPPALLAATSEADLMMPLSEICNQHRFSISSSVNTESSPPKSQAGTPNSSFVRRSLRKIMKRNGSVSTSALNGGEERLGSLKRRASNVSSFFNSAQAHLRPRTKSLKKQSCTSMFMRGPSSGGEEYGDAYFAASSTASLSSTSTSTSSSSPSPLSIGKKPKEKSGSDTFTFGNLFKRKPPTSRPNLADIISDLDQRSTTSRQMSSAGGSLSAGKNRRSTSATILPMNGGGPNEPDSSSLDAAALARRTRRKFSVIDPSEAAMAATGCPQNVYQNIFAQHLTICTTRDRRASKF